MSPAELQELLATISQISRGQHWEWIILALVFSAVGALIGAYLKRKGENLATREDISAITRAVEQIRSEYAEKLQYLSHQNEQLLQQQSHRHQMRLAALEKRLAAHQEAYTLWRKLPSSPHTACSSAISSSSARPGGKGTVCI